MVSLCCPSDLEFMILLPHPLEHQGYLSGPGVGLGGSSHWSAGAFLDQTSVTFLCEEGALITPTGSHRTWETEASHNASFPFPLNSHLKEQTLQEEGAFQVSVRCGLANPLQGNSSLPSTSVSPRAEGVPLGCEMLWLLLWVPTVPRRVPLSQVPLVDAWSA